MDLRLSLLVMGDIAFSGVNGEVFNLIAQRLKSQATSDPADAVDLKRTMRAMRDPYAIAFSPGAFLYVATACAIYVWMPPLLAGYRGPGAWVATYSISVCSCFVLEGISWVRGYWDGVLGRACWRCSAE